MRCRSALIALGPVLVFAACGDGDAAQSGEVLIETELEEQLDLGELTASCDQPDDSEVGTEFRCSATTEDDRVIEFLGVFTSEDEIFVSPTNLLTAAEVDVVREQSARILSPEVGSDIDPSQIECPAGDPVFLVGDTDGAVLECTITDPGTA
ncbi:MAG: hypothetical protein AAFP84_07015, partial [Actinomycetota bacterium]